MFRLRFIYYFRWFLLIILKLYHSFQVFARFCASSLRDRVLLIYVTLRGRRFPPSMAPATLAPQARHPALGRFISCREDCFINKKTPASLPLTETAPNVFPSYIHA